MNAEISLGSIRNKDEVAFYYDVSECRQTTPDRIRSDKHTMRENLWAYLGRANPDTGDRVQNDDILSKKFSEQQKHYLKRAYRQRIQVRVIGAEKAHYPELLRAYSRALLNEPGFEAVLHTRDTEDKIFNTQRALMLWTKPVQYSNSHQEEVEISAIELWVLVFPSKQYVDQVSELIQAIYDDFERVGIPGKGVVLVWHFNRLEREIGKWTQLERSLPLYIRHGEVVAIGNVEHLLKGITSIGYRKKFSNWIRFGLNNMFGIQILVNPNNNKRLVLLGVDECFWGEASALYVECLLKAGARHILYGSKAASMSGAESIHSIKSPSIFNVYIKYEANQGFMKYSSILGTNKSLRVLAQEFDINTAGINATVPTVIGEDDDQRQSLANLNPSTMDNEDGYIARIINEYNEKFSPAVEAFFLPVHFITDYIHKLGEKPKKNQAHLAVTQTEKRNKSFINIGYFFGVYASNYGLEEYVTIQTEINKNLYTKVNIEGSLRQVRGYVNKGMISEAIESLSNINQPISMSNLLAITLLCQKYGFIDDALKAINSINSDFFWEKLSYENKLLISIIKLRILTQTGNYLEAEDFFTKINSEFGGATNFMFHEHYNSLLRRRALVIAQRNLFINNQIDHKKNWSEALLWFAKSKSKVHRGSDDKHEEATCDLYYFIAALATDVAETHDYKERLSRARSLYLMSPKQSGPWMTNPEKSAANALFVEAAYDLLNFGNDDHCGLIRLGMAHLWNLRVGSTERSEGYGELINFIPDEILKDLFRRAMRTDNQGKREFRLWLQSKGVWTKIQKILEIFDKSIDVWAENLNNILKEIDEKWSPEDR